MTQPPLGWTTPCQVLEVYDGDTLVVEVTRNIRVRLMDCWAPELRQRGGLDARDHLRQLLKDKHVVLHVPGQTDVQDALTFGRVLGYVFADGRDVSQQMVQDGHAKEAKA